MRNELDVIAAVNLGGARITGGSGTVGGTLPGVVLVTLINIVLILAGMSSTWQKVIIEAFILVAGPASRCAGAGREGWRPRRAGEARPPDRI